ncbi:hypothetical protein HDU96_006273 [Phlyctochytrium bullatum]|nr:hypothetical protein HDU96_006273 [Phlyctochytrium bullatum]
MTVHAVSDHATHYFGLEAVQAAFMTAASHQFMYMLRANIADCWTPDHHPVFNTTDALTYAMSSNKVDLVALLLQKDADVSLATYRAASSDILPLLELFSPRGEDPADGGDVARR